MILHVSQSQGTTHGRSKLPATGLTAGARCARFGRDHLSLPRIDDFFRLSLRNAWVTNQARRLYEGPTYWWRDEGLKESRQMIDHLIYNLDILQCFNKETMFHINSTILHLSKERNVTWSRWKAICCFYPLAWIVGTHPTTRHKLTTWARGD